MTEETVNDGVFMSENLGLPEFGNTQIPFYADADQNYMSSEVSTNSNAYIEIADLTFQVVTGRYLILLSLTYSVSLLDEFLFVAIFKNGVEISGTERKVNSFSANLTSSLAVQLYSQFTSTDTISIRIKSSSVLSTSTVHEGGVTYIQNDNYYQLVSSNFNTNLTTPQEITGLTASPSSGKYVAQYTLTHSVSNADRILTYGIYLNSSLLPLSDVELILFPNQLATYQTSIALTVGSGDSIKIKVSVSNADTSVSISDSSVIFVPYY